MQCSEHGHLNGCQKMRWRGEGLLAGSAAAGGGVVGHNSNDFDTIKHNTQPSGLKKDRSEKNCEPNFRGNTGLNSLITSSQLTRSRPTARSSPLQDFWSLRSLRVCFSRISLCGSLSVTSHCFGNWFVGSNNPTLVTYRFDEISTGIHKREEQGQIGGSSVTARKHSGPAHQASVSHPSWPRHQTPLVSARTPNIWN